MPTVIFETLEVGGEPLAVKAPDGGSLGDLCDDVGAPIPFSCRSANCGTCRVHVLEGSELLLPADDEELDVLDAFGVAPPTQRLACQAKMRPDVTGLEVLRVRPVADDE
jgi:2Fe-2S ferredoxin